MTVSLKQNFAEHIKMQILSGKLKPGDKLPPERELAEILGLSRSSINQGILDLERIGFLTIVPRKGTYVADYIANATPETISAIMSFDSALIDKSLFIDLMQMRILIERECVRLACRRVNSYSIKKLNSCMQRIFTAEQAELPSALYDLHLAVTELSGNKAYYLIFQSFSKLLQKLIEAHYGSGEELAACIPLYSELAVAIKLSDALRADAAISAILDRASKYLISHLQGEDNY